jgi:hypothetical protein
MLGTRSPASAPRSRLRSNSGSCAAWEPHYDIWGRRLSPSVAVAVQGRRPAALGPGDVRLEAPAAPSPAPIHAKPAG